MKTYLLFFALLSVSLFKANAQEAGKPVVYIDFFSRSSSVDPVQAEAIRNKIIEGLHSSDRLQIIDVATLEQLSSEEERRKSESAMGDEVSRNSQMKTLGANYIVSGNITSSDIKKQTDDKGNVTYKGTIHWDIKIIDTETGTVKGSGSFTHTGGGLLGLGASSAEKAFIDTSDAAKLAMGDFVDDTFPIEGLILKVETASKKGDKAQTVIIDLGSNLGVTKGQRFIVYLETDIAGEVARREVGTLNAQEVLSAGRTICKVTKGGDKIIDAMNKEQTLIIVSRKSKLLEL